MKKIINRNQIAITSLAVLIAVAGYLNFTQNEIPTIGQSTALQEEENKDPEKDKESMAAIDTMDISDADSLISEKMEDPTEIEDEETIGEAVLTQAQVGEYIAGAKMEREQTHSKTKETLNQIIENESLGDAARQEAIDKLAKLADTIEKEASVEQLLDTKGYGDSVVSIGENNIDVILNYEELSQSDRAQIEDIVTRKTGCKVDQIIISRMKIS